MAHMEHIGCNFAESRYSAWFSEKEIKSMIKEIVIGQAIAEKKHKLELKSKLELRDYEHEIEKLTEMNKALRKALKRRDSADAEGFERYYSINR